MSMRYLAAGLLLIAVPGLTGCRRSVTPGPIVDDSDSHLREDNDIAVADWLSLTRPELDKLYEDWNSRATRLVDLFRGDRQTHIFLPKLKPALTLPVFQVARFSARAGVSLPPYADEGRKDPALALHLARFGDTDGALLLLDPADEATRRQVEALRAGRNYPVEWTRLIALAQFVGENELAGGDSAGASMLIHLHQQLRSALDPKAAAGPLGSVLLSGGKRALGLASVAWQDAGKTLLFGDVEEAINSWGEVAAPVAALPPGAGRDAVERIFPHGGKAHATTALGPAAARVFDLLALPLPADELDGVVAFLDGDDKLAQIALLYRPRAGQTYPDPGYLAQRLAGFGSVGEKVTTAKDTLREKFLCGTLNYDVTLIPRGSSIGGLVCVMDAKSEQAPVFMPADARDFGAVHFDRTFDQNRLAIAPEQRSAETITITKAAEVRRVAPPAAERGRTIELPRPVSVQLRRQEGHDLLSAVSLRWERGNNATILNELAVPLWTAYGAPRFEPEFDEAGGHLALVWEDSTMRYSLRLPHDEEQPADFAAEDKRGTSGAGDREKAAVTFDRDQRAERLAAGNPLQRLPRHFDEASGVRLGGSRAQVEGALPASKSLRKIEIENGWSVFFMSPTTGRGGVTPQQLFVRFGPDDKVAELRIRYLERAAANGDRAPGLLAHLQARSGAPEIGHATRAALWSDLPPQKPAPALYQWRDDTTIMTLQRDAGGSELTLRNRPADQPDGVALPPLRFVSRGVEGCLLGDAREGVLQHWKIADPTRTSDGGIVLPMPRSSPYEAVVAYFENDKVSLVRAYHKAKANFQTAEIPAALQESWGRDIDHLGAVRRQDTPAERLLGGFGWHDDVTRVRTYALDSDQGPRLYTEWREWSTPKGVAAAN